MQNTDGSVALKVGVEDYTTGAPPTCTSAYIASNSFSSPKNVWEVSEPGIYYHAAFLNLLSQYAQ
jgi:hypothetical protein